MRSPPARSPRMIASIKGMKKHRDLPDPVPVVTTQLFPAFAFAIASVWCRCNLRDSPSSRKTWPKPSSRTSTDTSSSTVKPERYIGLRESSTSGQKRPAVTGGNPLILIPCAYVYERAGKPLVRVQTSGNLSAISVRCFAPACSWISPRSRPDGISDPHCPKVADISFI